MHGDVAGAEDTRRALCDWLTWMQLTQAGAAGALDRYIGYYQPYATSHEQLDQDTAVQQEVRNAALSLAQALRQIREALCRTVDAAVEPPRKNRVNRTLV